jgi:hypothetical protein
MGMNLKYKIDGVDKIDGMYKHDAIKLAPRNSNQVQGK